MAAGRPNLSSKSTTSSSEVPKCALSAATHEGSSNSSGGNIFTNNDYVDDMAEGAMLAGSAEDEANDESCAAPWANVESAKAESLNQAPGLWGTAVDREKAGPSLSQVPSPLQVDDRAWIEELRAASIAGARDNLRIFGGIQGLGDKVDSAPLEALRDKLRTAVKMLLEYQQNPRFHSADTALRQAEAAAIRVYTNDRSLAMSLSALRIRVVITYLHSPKHSMGLEPSEDDKEVNKRQCELYITNALQERALQSLCQRYLACRNSLEGQLRDRVEQETVAAFDIILEVVSSVYVLEPFMPSKGPLPKGAPDLVMHALSVYCESGMGDAALYADLSRALQEWASTPERQERWALHCLYKSTNGPGWACHDGWDNVFEGSVSSMLGVSAEKGRVTKISLGMNNMEGKLPPELAKLVHLEELCLPGNKLFGKVPPSLWDLPFLRVVALHGNYYTVTPPGNFRPAGSTGASAGGRHQQPASRRLGVAGTVETCDPLRMEAFKGEWFACSWKIANTGSIAFARGTKLSRGDEHSILGGAEEVPVNPLEPGEEQTVTVMQQAPDFEGWSLEDEWFLVGNGLDFVGEEEARASTPLVTVAGRTAGSGRERAREQAQQTLGNTVFVAASKQRRGSCSSRRSSSSHLHPPGRFATNTSHASV